LEKLVTNEKMGSKKGYGGNFDPTFSPI